jgi:hypothetical protein
VFLRIPSSSRSPDHNPHRTIYYLGYPLGRFAGLKHRQLACQLGVIITTGRIRRTLVNKINLLVDSPRSIEASRLALVKAESIFLRRASGCFGTSHGSSSTTLTTPRVRCLGTSRGSSHGSSRCSSSTTPPRAGLSSTTSPTPRVRVPRHVARLVTRLVARLVARLVVDYSASRRLVVDYFASAVRPGASARRAARHAARRAARRRLLRLAQARRAAHRSSSTTPRVRVPRHIVWLVTRLVARLVVDNSASRRLVVDYVDSAARPGASARRPARHAARRAARRRLLCLAQARR